MPLRKNFDKNVILKAIQGNQAFGTAVAEAWQKRIEPYIPYNTGRLCNDVTIKPYQIVYNAPYADEVYNDLKRNFRKDKHPLATAKWSEVAAPAVMTYFEQDVQEIIDRMSFNG